MTEDEVKFKMLGVPGGLGNLEMSTVWTKFILANFSTVIEEDQEVSPLFDDAMHVYNPESERSRSEMKLNCNYYVIYTSNLKVELVGARAHVCVCVKLDQYKQT